MSKLWTSLCSVFFYFQLYFVTWFIGSTFTLPDVPFNWSTLVDEMTRHFSRLTNCPNKLINCFSILTIWLDWDLTFCICRILSVISKWKTLGSKRQMIQRHEQAFQRRANNWLKNIIWISVTAIYKNTNKCQF